MLDPGLPTERVYDADGVAPSLMHTASTMRSQAVTVRGGGSVNGEKDVCCIASADQRRTPDEHRTDTEPRQGQNHCRLQLVLSCRELR